MTDSQNSAANIQEQAFLAEYDAAQFPHPSVTVDVALLTADGGRLRAVLMKRDAHPDLGKWALPGSFVRMDESLEHAAERVLATKVGLSGIFLEQLYTFGQPERDPRTRVITIAYYALVDAARLAVALKADVQLADLRIPWEGEAGGAVEALAEDGQLKPLAFDHAEILGLVVQRLRGKLDYAPIGFELLPREFTLRDLQTIHETILGRPLNKDSFRRRLLDSGLIVPTGKLEQGVGHRPAELYRFASKRGPASKRRSETNVTKTSKQAKNRPTS
jgi:8-oxo-dGTP diphosphatase